jgi:hypothetical protein
MIFGRTGLAHYDGIVDGKHHTRHERFMREETLNTVETNIKFLMSLCRNLLYQTVKHGTTDITKTNQ